MRIFFLVAQGENHSGGKKKGEAAADRLNRGRKTEGARRVIVGRVTQDLKASRGRAKEEEVSVTGGEKKEEGGTPLIVGDPAETLDVGKAKHEGKRSRPLSHSGAGEEGIPAEGGFCFAPPDLGGRKSHRQQGGRIPPQSKKPSQVSAIKKKTRGEETLSRSRGGGAIRTEDAVGGGSVGIARLRKGGRVSSLISSRKKEVWET